jgi:hypothetical protein
MIAGAAMAHNFNMASTSAGATSNGKYGLVSLFILVLLIAIYNTFKKHKEGNKV